MTAGAKQLLSIIALLFTVLSAVGVSVPLLLHVAVILICIVLITPNK